MPKRESEPHKKFVQGIWRNARMRAGSFELRLDGVAGSGAIARAFCSARPPAWLSGTRHPDSIPAVYVFYPSWHDAELFAASAAQRLAGGMSESFPGSVGAMHARLKMLPGGGREVVIENLQGSFKHRSPRELSHAAVEPYTDFVAHLIEHLFKKRVDKQVVKVVMETAFGVRRGVGVKYGKNNAEIFRKIALLNGFKVREVASGLQVIAERT